MTAWMDLRQAAEYLGLSNHAGHRTVADWIRRGRIPEKYLGRRGRDLLVQSDGLDAAVRMMYQRARPVR